MRLVDLLFVRKSDAGTLAVLTASDLDADELREFGSFLTELVGLGIVREREPALEEGPDISSGHVFDKAEADDLAAVIPDGSSAAIVLLEHTWAVPLRSKIARARGKILSQEWIDAAARRDRPGFRALGPERQWARAQALTGRLSAAQAGDAAA